MDLVYFIILVGVLVFVHELGHYAWAKFFGVKVLRFSVGFGPRVAGFTSGDTEYVIAAVPLGGYVKMLGESPSDVISTEDAPRSFGAQPLLKRIIIVIAGPMMNLIFPLLLFFVVFIGDTEVAPPIIGTVFPDRPADGKLIMGDRVLAIDDDEIETFDDITRHVRRSAGTPLRFTIQRGEETLEEIIEPVLDQRTQELDRVDEVGRIGVIPHHPIAVVGVLDNGPAHAARLRTFDVLLSVSGRPVHRYLDIVEAMRRSNRSQIPITYLRPERARVLGGLADLDLYSAHVATLAPSPGRGDVMSRSGLEDADLYVHQVFAGSAEAAMGLRPSDRLVALDGRPIRKWATFLKDLERGRGEDHELVWLADGEIKRGRFKLDREVGETEHGQRFERYAVGVRNWLPVGIDNVMENPSRYSSAIGRAIESTVEMAELTIYSVIRLVQGRLSVKSIGGPLTIFDAASMAAREGTPSYLKLMAFISINLGLINLLPIPMLDGGHLLFFAIEGVGRRELSPRVKEWALVAGLALLLALMVLAFKNDIERRLAPEAPTTSAQSQ